METDSADHPIVNEAALALYRWTLMHGPLTPARLARAADETGLGAAICRAAVTDLTEARLFRHSAGRPDDPHGGQWTAESPQAASAQLLSAQDAALRAQEAVLHEQREQLQRRRDGFAALMPVYLQGRQQSHPQGMVDLLTDKFAVRAVLTETVNACRHEVIVSKPGGAFPPGAMREALPRDLELLGRGVRMRNLYQHVTRFDPDTRANAEQLIAAGAEIRTLPEVLPQVIIVDGELAFVPAAGGGALLIREPALLAYLLQVFERDWVNATPFAAGPQAAREVSEDLKRSILVLLAKGLKDEAIARRLSISLRTCRRHVSEILESLGAHSRFQAGVTAERLGLTTHREAPAPADPALPAPSSDARCPGCDQALPVPDPAAPPSIGRPSRYCSARCRSRAYRGRLKARTP